MATATLLENVTFDTTKTYMKTAGNGYIRFISSGTGSYDITLPSTTATLSNGIGSLAADTNPTLKGDLITAGNNIDYATGVLILKNTAADTQITLDGTNKDITILSNAELALTSTASAAEGSIAGAITLTATAGGITLLGENAHDIWLESGRNVIVSNENAAQAIYLHADAGTAQTIAIVNDQGTGTGAIGLTASAGGINIAATGNLVATGANASISATGTGANAIVVQTKSTGATSDKLTLTNHSGTTNGSSTGGAIFLNATAGGVAIKTGGTKALHLETATVTTKTSSAFTITHTASTASENFTIAQTGANDSSLLLTSAGTGTDAIGLTASAGDIKLTTTGTNKSVTIQGEKTLPVNLAVTGATTDASIYYSLTDAANKAYRVELDVVVYNPAEGTTAASIMSTKKISNVISTGFYSTFATTAISTAANTITLNPAEYNSLVTGQAVTLSGAADATTPAGAFGTLYYVIKDTSPDIKLTSTSFAAAVAGTPVTSLTIGAGTMKLISYPNRIPFNSNSISSEQVVFGTSITTLPTGTKVIYNAEGNTAVTGLTDGNAYYTIYIDSTHIKLASSLTNALAGTAVSPALAASASSETHSFYIEMLRGGSDLKSTLGSTPETISIIPSGTDTTGNANNKIYLAVTGTANHTAYVDGTMKIKEITL